MYQAPIDKLIGFLRDEFGSQFQGLLQRRS